MSCASKTRVRGGAAPGSDHQPVLPRKSGGIRSAARHWSAHRADRLVRRGTTLPPPRSDPSGLAGRRGVTTLYPGSIDAAFSPLPSRSHRPSLPTRSHQTFRSGTDCAGQSPMTLALVAPLVSLFCLPPDRTFYFFRSSLPPPPPPSLLYSLLCADGPSWVTDGLLLYPPSPSPHWPAPPPPSGRCPCRHHRRRRPPRGNPRHPRRHRRP